MQSASPTEQQRRSKKLAVIEPIAMRVPDACRYTGISRSTLYVLIASKDIEVIKLGASTLVLTESLKRLIDGRRWPQSARPDDRKP